MSAKFTLEGSGAGAVKAVQDYVKALDGAEKKGEKVAGSTKKLEEAAKKLAAQASPQEKYNQQMEKLAQSVKHGGLEMEHAATLAERYGVQLRNAGSAGESAFGVQALSQIKSYALGLVSVSGVLGEVRAQLQAIREENEKAARAKMTVADAEAALRETIAGEGETRANQVIEQARGLARERKMPEASVLSMVESAYAAGGDADLALESVREATRQSRNARRAEAVAGGIGDLINSTNIDSVEEASGYLALLQATSRIKGEKVARAAAGTASAYTAQGGSEAAAAAALSALSVAGTDAEGDLSRTAAVNLQSKSAAWFAKHAMRLGLSAEDHDTIDERIALLQGNSEWSRQFMAETKFQAATQGAVAKLLQDQDTIALYRKAYDSNDERAERITAAEERANFIGQGEIQNYAKSEDAIATLSDQLRAAGDADLSDESRENVFELSRKLEGSGRGMWARAKFYAETGPTLSRDEAIRQLEGGIALQDWRTGGKEALMQAGTPTATAELARRETAEEMLAELKEQSRISRELLQRQTQRITTRQE